MNIRISLAMASALLVFAPLAPAAQDLSRRATVAADATIEVSNIEGRVDVKAWDRNEVELRAQLESDEDTLEFEATQQQVRIKVEKPKGKRKESSKAILTLKIPQGARLTTQTVSADIEVGGLKGEQRLNTVSGDIRTQAFDEPVSVRTVSGDATIRGSGGKAALSVNSVSGSTDTSGVRGDFEGKSVSGNMKLDIATAARIDVKAISGDVGVQAELSPGARVEMESVSGSVKLKVKPPVNAEFDLESFSGSIKSCFDAKPRDKGPYGPGRELRFRQGEGSARVRIKSMSGDLSICDR